MERLKIYHINYDGNRVTVYVSPRPEEDGKTHLYYIEFWPISRNEYDEKTSFEGILRLLKENLESHEDYESFEDMAQSIIEDGAAEQWAFDAAYRELWGDMRERLGMTEDEAYIFDCCGCGLC